MFGVWRLELKASIGTKSISASSFQFQLSKTFGVWRLVLNYQNEMKSKPVPSF